MPLDLAQPSPLKPSRRRSAGGDDDVDLTPMIDVTFLMLIFFLVSSVPDDQTEVSLPEALHGNAVSQLEAVVFTLGEAGAGPAPVYAADGRVPEALLPAGEAEQADGVAEAIAAGLREGKTNVVIKADRSVPYREVARVVANASASTGVKLHLAVLDSE